MSPVLARRLLFAALLLLFCAGLQAQQPLRIAAAADLEPLLPTVIARFEKQTGIHAQATYKSSATLAQQIINGAPFDLFMAADTGFPQRVIDAGLANESSPIPYAQGTLVLWARKDTPLLAGKPLSLAMLSNPRLQSVAIANPQHAPYGRAAQAAIHNLGLEATLKPKLRVAENIAQAAQYAQSGNAEVGFLSLTSALTPRLAADGTFIRIPASDYPPLRQAAVILKRGSNTRAAAGFLNFLREPTGRTMLATKGLLPPQK